MKNKRHLQRPCSRWHIRPGNVIISVGLLAIFGSLSSGVNCIAQVIHRAEYFINTDPGNGNATPLTITSPGSNVNFSFSVPTASLSTGFHRLGFRIRESITGRWSHTQFNTFYIIPPLPGIDATTITAGEYFFDADPGFGNGTAFSFTSGSSVSFISSINIGSLTPGFHTLNCRFKDNQNKWTHTLVNSFYVIPPLTGGAATSITAAEYFIDNDLGVGNNTAISITAGSPQNNLLPITLPNTLTPGFHQIGFRYRDNRNRWSHANTQTFYILPPINTGTREIVAARYFVDNTQGIGTGIALPGITRGSTIDQLVAIDMTGVPTGAHTLTIQVRDSEGVWSYLVTENFSVSACTPPAAPVVPAVSRCEAGTLTLAASGATGTQQYRWYDDATTNTVLFTGVTFTTPNLSASRNYFVSIFDPVTNCESSRTQVAATVTILAKPAVNPSGDLSFCAGSSVVLSAPTGFSQYTWSTGETTRQIFVNGAGSYTVEVGDGTCISPASDPVNVSVITAPAKPVISVSGSTVICGGNSVTLTGPAGFEYQWSNGAVTQAITVSQAGVFFLRVKSGNNCFSEPSDPIVVTVQAEPCGGNPNGGTCTPPTPPVVNAVSRCGPGAVTLTATGASGTQQYRWYDNSTSNTILFTGSTFTTPGLSASRNYYVTIFDPADACESNRALAAVSLSLTAKPVINPFGDVSFCEGSSVVLSAPTGFAQYTWSTGETTREISVSTTGTYSVQVGDGTCVSPASDPLNVTVLSPPEKPVVSITGNPNICGTGSVTLTGPSGFEYAWSNGATTQAITLSQAGVYFLRIKSGNNCFSAPSDPVAVTVQSEPCGGATQSNQSPVINSSPLSSAIEGVVTVDLTKLVTDADANVDYATLRLLTTTTARGGLASIDAFYNLVIDYRGIPFTGTDRIGIEVCDLAGACVQQVLDIEVVGAVVVYNGVTSNGDGKNDILLLKYIDVVKGADQNKVTIFNRWGDVVFDTENYNNTDRVFSGRSNAGTELPAGTYFYKIEFEGQKPIAGFLTLKD